MSIDLGVLYGAARARIAELVSRPDTDPHLPVPATPRWSVHDVVAHVAGVAADGTSGNMAGAPGEEWTAAQVQRSATRSIADLLDEWERTGQLMEGFLSSPAGVNAAAAVMDIHTHEADLRHALGMATEVPDDFLEWAGETMRVGFADAVAAAGLPPVQVTAPDIEWFRGRLGRRTEAEVRALDWSAEPGPYLDEFFIFGRAEQSLGERA